MTEDYTERNQEIVNKIDAAGKRRGILTNLANEYGLTRERVRAIYAASKKDRMKSKRQQYAGRLPGVSIEKAHEAILKRMVVEMKWETVSHAVRLAVAILVATDVATLESQAKAQGVDPAALAAKAINTYLNHLTGE